MTADETGQESGERWSDYAEMMNADAQADSQDWGGTSKGM